MSKISTVLLIEPDAITGSLLGTFAHQAGCYAAHAPDPVSAVKIHRQTGDVAAALVEMALPGPWSAYQLCTALRQNQPDIAIILMSASGANAEAAMALNMPFLRKPFTVDEMMTQIFPRDERVAA